MLVINQYPEAVVLYENAASRIYRAARPADGTSIIIKTLSEEWAAPEQLQRLKYEYTTLQLFHCPRIIRPIAFEEDTHRRPFLVLEDIGGTSLATLGLAGQLSIASFLELACTITEALTQLHAYHYVHRDLNPANIIFNPTTNQLQLIDFEFALPLADMVLTPIQVIEGTVSYLAPEQTGRTAWPIDQRADLYALGCTLYELASGAPPFPGHDMLEVIHAHLSMLPPPLPAMIPPPVVAIIAKLLAKHPDERYQSASGALADLRNAQEQWESHGSIQAFVLGGHDHSARLMFPPRLYGREHEQSQLQESLAHVINGGSTILLLTGEGGSGKSALVQTLLPAIHAAGGYFASGKFDQLQRATPYSALIEAGTMLVQQLLTEPEERLSVLRTQLLRALSANAGVMTGILPLLSLVIGPQPAAPPLGLQETQNRFLLTFQQFLSVFTSPTHPLVIFLDDLQWADSSSLHVLNYLGKESALPGLLFIGAYRDGEVGPHHALWRVGENLRASDVPVRWLTIQPLEMGAIGALMADTLQQDQAVLEPLIALFYRKTEGNVLFVRELLRALAERRLLWIDDQTRQWCWDIVAIENEVLTENVVDLLAQKLHRLPSEGRRLLMLAAALGNEIDATLLAHLSGVSLMTVEQQLQELVVASLVHTASVPVRDNRARYRFVHDRVQQAAYDLLAGEDRPVLHYQIGMMLLSQLGPTPSGSSLFDVISHLNAGHAALTSAAEREQLIQLNLTAGQQALSAAAYGTALSYFETGIILLGGDAWRQSYACTMALHLGAASAALFSGARERMQQLVAELQSHALNDLDHAEGSRLLVEASIADNRLKEAILIGLAALRILGVDLPDRPTKGQILKELLRTMFKLRGKEPLALVDLPRMTNPRALLAIRLLTTVDAAAFFAMPDLLPLIIMRSVQIFLQYGNTEMAGKSYVLYGFLLSAVVGQIDRGYAFGQLGLKLSERHENSAGRAGALFTFGTFLAHYKLSTQETQQIFRDAYQAGLDVGDLQSACYGVLLQAGTGWYNHTNLMISEEEIAIHSRLLQQMNQATPIAITLMTYQFLQNLRGKVQDPAVLDGEVFSEYTQIPVLQKNNAGTGLFDLYHYKTILGYLFDDPDVFEAITQARRYFEHNIGTVFIPFFLAYESLNYLAHLPRQTSLTRQRTLLRVTINQRKLATLARHAPMNFLHLWHLVEAERCQAQGKEMEAHTHYQQAVGLAHKHGFRLEEALAYERAAMFYRKQQQTLLADMFLQQAHAHYNAWGAVAKVRQLEKAFPYLALQPHGAASNADTAPVARMSSRHIFASTLDLASLLKSSYAITREIELPKLVATLLHLARENAGADAGYLLFEQDGAWHPAIQEATSIIFPEMVLSYVARTHEPLVLADATQTVPFSADPAFVTRRPRSLACVPLINQGQLIALLYLENTFLPDAFTAERIELVRLVAAQAAIALENARLYQQLTHYNRTLEEQVDLRTIQLEHAREAAEEANRLKSQFLANMSHELRTPLNAIINFTHFALDSDYGAVNDVQGEFLQRVVYNSEHLLGLINDILDLSKIEAGKMELQLERADLSVLLRGVMSTAIGLTAHKGLSLDLDIPEVLPELWIDKQRVRQVVLNLLSNAAKFTEKGGITVQVTQLHDDQIQIAVKDTGIGIPAEHLDTVFAEFQQVESNSALAYQGTGLGLAISKQFINLHGGAIGVRSTVGAGSTFWFTLPLQRPRLEFQCKSDYADNSHAEYGDRIV